jgi:hypothetical protein
MQFAQGGEQALWRVALAHEANDPSPKRISTLLGPTT